MPAFVSEGPIWLIVCFLFVIVFLRSHATYWAGRGIAAGVLRSRWADKLSGPRITRGREALAKWGWPIIPISYLTIGFQTAVMASAGLVQMRYWKFTLASLPGCLVWAAIYGMGGLAVFMGAFALALKSPWWLAGVAAVAGAIVAGVVLVRHRRAEASAEPAVSRD